MNSCLVADVGGLPMIDDHVKTSAIATLVCAIRQRLDNRCQPLAAYLQPELARECYRNASAQPVTEHESIAMTDAELEIIRTACEAITETVPCWKVYFAIPLSWRRLIDDLFSSSNPLIPQHIYLGERCIRGRRLTEHIVHEVSHTWVGMIAEVVPLALPGGPLHMLPSGTPDKEIRQVIYALTFAATAIRFYRACIAKRQANPDDAARLRYLERYTAGCLEIVDSSDLLLPDGRLMVESCRRALHC